MGRADGIISLQLGGKDTDDRDQPYILAANGKKACVNRDTWSAFAKEAGLPKASYNTVRKSATTTLRKDEEMRAIESVVLDHSDKTADVFYEQARTSQQVRQKI